MPKIEVYGKSLFSYTGRSYTDEEFEAALETAKAELDGKEPEKDLLKVELNDTNRPDLWSTAGLGRQLRVHETGEIPSYDFFSTPKEQKDCGERIVNIDPSVEDIRPYEIAIAVKGREIDEATLKDIIQTQEKLCWNFGRKRRSIAIGVFRSDLLTFPIKYLGADPDTTRFVPLQTETEMSLRQMITDIPKGREYGYIVKDFDRFPYLEDTKGYALSFPPVINSAYTGAVQVGDENLFIEMTGTELKDLILTANIVACDLADAGFTVLPVKMVYPFDTEFGREIVAPFYFQEPIDVDLEDARKLLGTELAGEEAQEYLRRMGVRSEIEGNTLHVEVPPYRNDFLHPVDVIEDIIMGRGMETFEPVMPHDFTVGRLTAEEEFSRKVKEVMIGLGYQEMMYNYLGSKRDYIDKMEISGEEFVRIANPMSENYEYVRASIIPNMLQSEAVSAHAVYPHRIFEVGKTAVLKPENNSGTATYNTLGFLLSDREVGFNEASAHVSALFYYVGLDYELEEIQDPRFISGRVAAIVSGGERAGVCGEVHPQVLENWGIQMPCTACEVNLDLLRGKED
ncbi:MAG: phenylalanine--tRNA ligase subunit beta [Spirochaetaceae bacterium]